MIQDLDAATGLPALLAVVLGLVVVLAALAAALLGVRRSRAAAAREVAALRAELAALRAELTPQPTTQPTPQSPPQAVPARAATEQEYVITHVGDPDAPSDAPAAVAGERIDGRLFADLVLREGVVQAAALAHGLRRALAPEHRDLVRGAVRREVRQARRRRRADLRADLREVRRRRAAEARHPLLGDGFPAPHAGRQRQEGAA